MCGICGIVDFASTPDLDLLRSMTARLVHRGPDGNGYVRDRVAALGHTRLAIVDVAGSAQPMSTPDGGCWVTFNGEIFNYVELRETLRAAGHVFRTNGDTEVILAAYRQWGEGCFERFNGQWAIALWDRAARRLVLSRDRLGVRPLYYARTPHGVAFASEVKALFADPALARGFDPAGLHQSFSLWSTVAPRTVFAGVDQLPPGHLAVLDESGWRARPYWRIAFPAAGAERGQDSVENAEALREKIVDAVRLRFLRSDVPVGAYLSGGLDSAVTTAVIAKYTDAPLRTFSLRFSDAEFDEGEHQALMSRVLGTEHTDVVVAPQDIAEVFPQVVRHAEAPLLRAAPAPLFLLSKLVADNGFKVVVTGEGADEVMAGYDLFREAAVRLFWSRDPGSAVRGRAAELLYPWMSRSPGRAPAFARSFFARNLDPADPALSHRPRWDSTAVLAGLLSADLRAAGEQDGPDGAGRHAAAGTDELVASMPPESVGWDPLARAQWLEMTTLLAGYILASQGDRMLMANSVEGRFPFLDREVVDFAATLPARHKLFGLEEKYLLKRAFADLVPDAILRRPKQPYRAPDASSFFAGGRSPDWLDAVTCDAAVSQAGVFEPRLVRGLLDKCRRGAGDPMGNTDNMRTLAVVSTQLLHAELVVGAGAGAAAPLAAPDVAVDLADLTI